MTMRGECLCGQVRFELSGGARALYQCHCSLCRKQGGSLSNTATLVAADEFRWLAGAALIRSWVKDSGFRSDFCSHCGSPLPNPLRGLPYYWVPAGLLAADAPLTLRAQLCVASKAAYDPLAAPGVRHDALPGFDELLASLALDPPADS